MKIVPAGENSLMIYLADEASSAIFDILQSFVSEIQKTLGDGLIDVVPSYASVLVIYAADQLSAADLMTKLQRAYEQAQTISSERPSQVIELPVYYGEDVGIDLERVSSHSGLKTEAVIELHQMQEYRVYAIGFAPGFAYLGKLDPKIATPRLATPRKQVAQGAVAIADRQTAVYPAPSPGGWNIIGRCPTPLFDPKTPPHMPVQVGDRVRFFAIDQQEFLRLGGHL